MITTYDTINAEGLFAFTPTPLVVYADIREVPGAAAAGALAGPLLVAASRPSLGDRFRWHHRHNELVTLIEELSRSWIETRDELTSSRLILKVAHERAANERVPEWLQCHDAENEMAALEQRVDSLRMALDAVVNELQVHSGNRPQ